MQTTHLQMDTETKLVGKMLMLQFPVRYDRKIVGPIVTTYYFTPLGLQPLAKILSRTEDLAMACGVESIIIKRELSQLLVEVPNAERSLIRFDNSLHWLCTNSSVGNMALPLLMGQHTNGENFAIDLADQPHLLIAGSTGSGKSVFLAELISSLAILKSKAEVRFILVDTKQLELPLFSMLSNTKQVVTDILELHDVLEQTETIIRQRMTMMKGLARNIREYNTAATVVARAARLYHIVIVIDELADIIDQDRALAQTEDKESKRVRIEARLKTITQISRAAGVHIIAATQRPSVRVINGDIKANFPTRISFKLPSSGDSRTVLGENGAESLLGRGDYLYQLNNSDTTTRAHGAFLSMADIKMVVEQSEYIRGSLIGIGAAH